MPKTQELLVQCQQLYNVVISDFKKEDISWRRLYVRYHGISVMVHQWDISKHRT